MKQCIRGVNDLCWFVLQVCDQFIVKFMVKEIFVNIILTKVTASRFYRKKLLFRFDIFLVASKTENLKLLF